MKCCPMKCPITGVNIPRFLICIVVGSLFFFSFEFMLHGQFLAPTYAETPDLWRAPEAMQSYMNMNMIRIVLIVTLVALIYTRNHEGKGVSEGLRFGTMIGALLGVVMASGYIWMPISDYLGMMWFAGGFGIGLGLGLINSILYKAASEETCATQES